MKSLIADILSGKTTVDASIQTIPSINAYDFLKAKSYLDIMSFSREQLISQLEYEGFTHGQAVYGVTANGL